MITVEEAKKELFEYQQNTIFLEEKDCDMLELRTRLEKTTKRLSAEPKGKGENKDKDILAESVDKLEEIYKEHDENFIKLLLKKFVIDDKIESMEQPFKNILYMKYARNKSLGEISDKINYSYKYVCELHGRALQEYAKL